MAQKGTFIIREGERVCISLATLYPTLKDSANGRRTRCGDLLKRSKDGDSEWFDLYVDGDPDPVCCDGETGTVSRVSPDGTVCIRNDESGKSFVLSPEEAGNALYNIGGIQ